MKKIGDYLKKSRFYYGITALLSVFMTGAIILSSALLGRFTEGLSRLSGNGIVKLLLLVLAAFFSQELLDYFYQILRNKIEIDTYSNIQKKLLYQELHLSFDHPKLKKSSGLYTLMSCCADDLTRFLSITMPDILFQTIRLLFALTFIIRTNWQISFVYIGALLLSLVIQFLIGKTMEKASYRVKKSEADLNAKLKDVLENRLLIKVSGCFDWTKDFWKEQEQSYVKANLRMSLQTMPFRTMGIISGIFPILCLCFAGIYLTSTGKIKVSEFMTLFYLCQNILPDQLHYADLWEEVIKVKPAAQQLTAYFEEKEPQVEWEKENGFQTGEMVLEHIYYRYPEREAWAVKDISLQLERGKKIAFVGASGSGKSTLMKLMAGLILPQNGRIQGEKGRYTDQFPFLFTDSLMQNILYSGAYEEERFEKACENACLEEFVSEMEQGYDTAVTENGEGLSRGQRQRVALARSLNSESALLLHDEVFSALDSELAKNIMKKLKEEYPDITMVFSLHQKELLPFMDEIYLFDSGCLLEKGTYRELQGKLAHFGV